MSGHHNQATPNMQSANTPSAQPVNMPTPANPENDSPFIPPGLLSELGALASPRNGALATTPNPEVFTPFIQAAVSEQNATNIKAFVDFLYTNALPLPVARQLHYNVIQAFLTNFPDSVILVIAPAILTSHSQSTRSFTFESSMILLCDRLASIHETRGNPHAAANALVSMPMDHLATLPDDAHLRCILRIARLLTAAGRAVEAVSYLNRASKLINQNTDSSYSRQYRIIHAETLRAQGRFSDAAAKYHQLSQDLADGDWLKRAVICAILAPAGPRKSRILATLFADERIRALEVFSLFECIHMGHLLSPAQVERLREGFGADQKEGVLDRAVKEHNLSAASRLYADIGFGELGTLLGVTAAAAESTAATMIKESRLIATIDQVEGVLRFAPRGKTVQIERWDAHIASLCSAVDDAVEAIITKFPQFADHLEA